MLIARQIQRPPAPDRELPAFSLGRVGAHGGKIAPPGLLSSNKYRLASRTAPRFRASSQGLLGVGHRVKPHSFCKKPGQPLRSAARMACPGDPEQQSLPPADAPKFSPLMLEELRAAQARFAADRDWDQVQRSGSRAGGQLRTRVASGVSVVRAQPLSARLCVWGMLCGVWCVVCGV